MMKKFQKVLLIPSESSAMSIACILAPIVQTKIMKILLISFAEFAPV